MSCDRDGRKGRWRSGRCGSWLKVKWELVGNEVGVGFVAERGESGEGREGGRIVQLRLEGEGGPVREVRGVDTSTEANPVPVRDEGNPLSGIAVDVEEGVIEHVVRLEIVFED